MGPGGILLRAFLTASYAAGAVACVRVLLAGRAESLGRLERARQRAHGAGLLGGGAAGAACGGWAVAVGTSSCRPVHLAVAAALLTAAAGWTILLAGLSGKPRPTGTVGAFLWTVATVVAVSALRAC